MSPLFNTLTHNLRRALALRGIALSLGHAHQLLAASLGYKSKAAWEAVDRDPDSLGLEVNWLVDRNQLMSRAGTLELLIDDSVFIASLADASRELAGPRVFGSTTALLEMITHQAQRAALGDTWIRNRLRDEFRPGPYSADLEPLDAVPVALPQIGEGMRLVFSCSVYDEHDLDDDSPGFVIPLTIEARLTMMGRRLISAPALRILEIALRKTRVEIGMSTVEAGQYVNLSQQTSEALESGHYAGTQTLISAHDLFFEKLARLHKAPHYHDVQNDLQSLVTVFEVARGPVPLSLPIDVVGADNFLGLDDAPNGRKVMKSMAIDIHTRRVYVHRKAFDPVANSHILKFAQRHLVTA
jgi:DNA-binding XRE family transcriptional regulator